MTVIVQDNWSGSGNLSGRTPSPTSGVGTWIDASTEGRYVSGQARANDGGVNCRHSVSVLNARIGCVVNVGGSLGGGQSPARLWLRADSSFNNGYYAQFLESGGNGGLENTVKIVKVVSGGATDLAAVGYPANEVTGLAYSFQAVGSTLRVTRSGLAIIEITDTTFSSAGFPGFFVATYNDPENSHESTIGPLTIETPYLDVTSVAPAKAVTNGLVSSVGVGYLGAADIALISQSILATLQANTIPVNVEQINAVDVASNILPVNVQQVVGYPVAGSGTEADPWGPA